MRQSHTRCQGRLEANSSIDSCDQRLRQKIKRHHTVSRVVVRPVNFAVAERGVLWQLVGLHYLDRLAHGCVRLFQRKRKHFSLCHDLYDFPVGLKQLERSPVLVGCPHERIEQLDGIAPVHEIRAQVYAYQSRFGRDSFDDGFSNFRRMREACDFLSQRIGSAGLVPYEVAAAERCLMRKFVQILRLHPRVSHKVLCNDVQEVLLFRHVDSTR